MVQCPSDGYSDFYMYIHPAEILPYALSLILMIEIEDGQNKTFPNVILSRYFVPTGRNRFGLLFLDVFFL